MSSIEWTNATWNPTAGCSIVSKECKRCYAMRQAHRLAKMGQEEKYGGLTEVVNGQIVWNGTVRLSRADLEKPLEWGKPKMIFVDSMSDLFHEDVPYDYIDEVLSVMIRAHWHTYQTLTKRAGRMMRYFQNPGLRDRIRRKFKLHTINRWPLPNAWWGTSVGYLPAKERIISLRATPAAVRFLSCEPLLEDLGVVDLRGIHWVIAGGESGAGASECQIDWIRNLARQCREQGVRLFVKQLGAVPSMLEHEWRLLDATRLLSFRNRERVTDGFVPLKMLHGKGGNIEEWPPDLRIREFPEGV